MAKGNTTRKERKGRPIINASRPRTRGQRPKLHDPVANTAELTAQLRSLGLYAAPTLGDGNCLFRALSDQIYGTPNEHLPLRVEICEFMAEYPERFEAFVDEDQGLDRHLSAMQLSGTYGGHLELTAFAQLKALNVKVVQPGLVYVIEGGNLDNFGPKAEKEEGSSGEAGPSNSREKRKAKKERMKKKAAEVDEEDEDEEDKSGRAPFPATVYVAYHDWEHFSSVRNLTGPHQGIPYVEEVPPPGPDMDISSLPSPPPSTAPTKSKPKRSTAKQPPKPPQPPATPESLEEEEEPPQARRSPKRAIDEDYDDESGSESRKRGRRDIITVVVDEEEDADVDVDGDDDEEEVLGLRSSAGSFVSDTVPPPPPEPEPEPEPALTKRQRKSLGLPKSRAAPARARSSTSTAAASKAATKATKATKAAPRPSTRLASKAVATVERRETRSATKVHRDAGRVRDLGTGEWLDNGTGRLDVRGFRELRI